MNIHEWQAKELLAAHGVAIPRGGLPADAVEASAIAESFGGRAVVKAQIHAGGRGKGGGVKLAENPAEAAAWFDRMMGMTLVTPQTGPKGRVVRAVYLSEAVAIDRELYLSLLVDRGSSRVALLASTEGGMEIEQVAAEAPQKLFRLAIDPATGIGPHHARDVAAALGFHGEVFRQFQVFLLNVYNLFIKNDCSLVEINPLVVTKSGELLALDAKISLDDNAMARHPELAIYRDPHEESPEEVEASRYGLNFIKLDGTIGCMVNGAGLAMATMDIIKLCGGEPANFLDVGGGASEEAVKNAFGIILRDRAVKAVLVNIFGGIVRCDLVARGIIKAAREMDIHVPVVVRLEGTNADEGRHLLAESGLDLRVAEDLGAAARIVVASIA
ncbi:ADP-forming succinate--CoA ligase subunit beta [Holophaga foetida]|uniref:ADP-forming succinate--CoA ligase subunit beta n=1 Tax=Holophaga foetida TaxID=35839 RepID=UPI000247499D|nr:ADP-forming succinate--CoA ligase subunit beta [Holophaga foetida]